MADQGRAIAILDAGYDLGSQTYRDQTPETQMCMSTLKLVVRKYEMDNPSFSDFVMFPDGNNKVVCYNIKMDPRRHLEQWAEFYN